MSPGTFAVVVSFAAALTSALSTNLAWGQSPRPDDDWKIGIQIRENRENGVRSGVLITQVIPGSPAEGIHLCKGDVLHAVDGILFDDPAALRADVMGKDRQRVTLVWQRGPVFLEQACKLKIETFTETYTVKVPITTERDGKTVTEYVEEERTRSMSKVAGIEPIGEPVEVADPRQRADGPRRVTDPRGN